MKKLISIAAVLLLLASCTTSKPPSTATPPPSGLSLPVKLVRELTDVNNCEDTFWESDFGQVVVQSKKSLNVKAYFQALERAPSTCSLHQARSIAKTTVNVTQAIKKESSITKDGLKNHELKLRTVENNLIKNNMTALETLTQLNLLNTIIDQMRPFKNKQLNNTINDVIKNLNAKIENIFVKMTNSDILIMQNTMYRFEIYDWNSLGILSSDQPTEEKLARNLQFNKYDEILKLEDFKKIVQENHKCLLSKTCFVCEGRIGKTKCDPADFQRKPEASEKLAESILEMIYFSYQNGVDKYISYFEKLNSYQLKN